LVIACSTRSKSTKVIPVKTFVPTKKVARKLAPGVEREFRKDAGFRYRSISDKEAIKTNKLPFRRKYECPIAVDRSDPSITLGSKPWN
jgi:hypothetical protein